MMFELMRSLLSCVQCEGIAVACASVGGCVVVAVLADPHPPVIVSFIAPPRCKYVSVPWLDVMCARSYAREPAGRARLHE